MKWTSETQDPHSKPREAGRGRTLQIEKHMGRMKEEETKETNLEEFGRICCRTSAENGVLGPSGTDCWDGGCQMLFGGEIR